MPIAGPSVSMTWYGRAILRHSGSAATPVASLRPSPFRRSVTPFQKLSVGSNKTAVMAQPVGAGAHHTRRVLFAKAGLDGHVRAFREHAAPLKVPLVPTYRHLGMQHALHGKMATEIAYRSAQARAAFQEARRKVFKAPGVPLLRKVFILRASVLPEPSLWGRSLAATRGPGVQYLRRLPFEPLPTGFVHTVRCDQHCSAATVLALVQLPGPAVTLHVQRLLYLSQPLRTGLPTLWALFRQDRT